MSQRVVLHTADLHIGKNRKHGDYLEQQRLMLDSIIRITEETIKTSQEVWLIVAGDVFDRNEDTLREELVLFMGHLLFPLLSLKQKHTNFSYFIVDGNHDRQPNLEEPSVLSAFLPLTSNLAVKDPIYFAGERLLLVPFGGYSEASFRELLKSRPAEFVVAHECLSRMQTDTGWSPPRDQDNYIEINNVLNSDVAGIFLGDIHKCQSLDEGQRVWYSGSPTTLDHGHKLPKGVLRHEYTLKSDGRWQQACLPELVPLGDARIKQHFQMGRLVDPQIVPITHLAERFGGKHYIQATVSPEVYQLIDSQIPGFFTSSLVSWEFDRKDQKAFTLSNDDDEGPGQTLNNETETEESGDYYRPLIEQWLAANTEHLTQDERQDCLKMLLDDFTSRS